MTTFEQMNVPAIPEDAIRDDWGAELDEVYAEAEGLDAALSDLIAEHQDTIDRQVRHGLDPDVFVPAYVERTQMLRQLQDSYRFFTGLG